ncbi:MAG: hypothetical protein ABFD89_02040, partial [Bryobacteraceae bacterium]
MKRVAPTRLLILLAMVLTAAGAEMTVHHRTPAGARTPIRRPGADSILPGGRLIEPLGFQYHTGPGPFGLAISPTGKTVVSANSGPNRFSVTVLKQRRDRWAASERAAVREDKESEEKEGPGVEDKDEWHSVYMGLALRNDLELWASEGNSGRVRLMLPISGNTQQVINLNYGGFADSYSGDMALDPKRDLLYVVDQANFRV